MFSEASNCWFTWHNSYASIFLTHEATIGPSSRYWLTPILAWSVIHSKVFERHLLTSRRKWADTVSYRQRRASIKEQSEYCSKLESRMSWEHGLFWDSIVVFCSLANKTRADIITPWLGLGLLCKTHPRSASSSFQRTHFPISKWRRRPWTLDLLPKKEPMRPMVMCHLESVKNWWRKQWRWEAEWRPEQLGFFSFSSFYCKILICFVGCEKKVKHEVFHVDMSAYHAICHMSQMSLWTVRTCIYTYIYIYHLESRWRNSHVFVYHGPLLSRAIYFHHGVSYESGLSAILVSFPHFFGVQAVAAVAAESSKKAEEVPEDLELRKRLVPWNMIHSTWPEPSRRSSVTYIVYIGVVVPYDCWIILALHSLLWQHLPRMHSPKSMARMQFVRSGEICFSCSLDHFSEK